MLRMVLLSILVTGLLLLPGAVGAQNVKSSTDEKGTICIGNPESPGAGKKGSETKAILWPEGTLPTPDPNAPLVAVPRSKQMARRQKRMMFGDQPPIMPKWSSPPASPAPPPPQAQPPGPSASEPHQGE